MYSAICFLQILPAAAAIRTGMVPFHRRRHLIEPPILYLDGAIRGVYREQGDSKPGLGPNVELWLPVNDKASNAIQIVPDPGQVGRTNGSALLVDDDDMVRMSTADMLVRPFDARHDRVDLAHAVRARLPRTPVLIISGFAEAEGIASDLPRLTKPFRQAELAATVSGLLSQPDE
jgi:hypothetical protein